VLENERDEINLTIEDVRINIETQTKEMDKKVQKKLKEASEL